MGKAKARGLLSVRGDRPVLRSLLLMAVFLGTAVAFWWNFERRMAVIAPPQEQRFLQDADGLLSVEQARALQPWRQSFRQSLGLDVLVQVSSGAVVVPPFDRGTLFVGVGRVAGPVDAPMNDQDADQPGAQSGAQASAQSKPEAVIVLPPLARKALGEGARLQAEESLTTCLSGAPAAACLQKTLLSLWQQLGGQ